MSDRKLIVFDFDGTLVDSQSCFDIGLAEFSDSRSLPHDPIKMMIGYVDPKKNDLGWGVPLEDQAALFGEFCTFLDHECIENKRFIPDLYDNVTTVLKTLQQDFDLSIITARSRSTMLVTLEHHGLKEFSPHYRTHCCAKERNYPIKPEADALHCLLRDTNHVLEDVVMIGDTTADIGMANAAGTKSIAVLWGAHSAERLQPANPTMMIHQVTEMPAAIKQIFSR